MGSSKSQTVGYDYSCNAHFVICRGYVDALIAFKVDDGFAKPLLDTDAPFVAGRIYNQNMPSYFGGGQSQGGLVGDLLPTSGDYENSTSLSVLQSLWNAATNTNGIYFKGVFSVFLSNFNIGRNPFFKEWKFLPKRIHKTSRNELQWYDAKAEIAAERYVYFDAGKVNFPTQTAVADGGVNGVAVDASAHALSNGVFSQNLTILRQQLSYVVIGSPPSSIDQFVLTGLDKIGEFYAKLYFKIVHTKENHTITLSGGVSLVGEMATRPANNDDISNFTNLHNVTEFFLNWDASKDFRVLSRVTKTTPSVSDASGTYLGTNNIRFSFVDDFDTAVFVGQSGDMNPAHIIYDTLTDPFDSDLTADDLDEASFTAAADIFYDELLGLSVTWDQTTTINEFIDLVLNHCDSIICEDRRTGKLKLKPIRNNYTKSALPIYSDAQILDLSDYSIKKFGDLTTRVTVTYYDRANDADGTITVYDNALEQQQGKVIVADLKYPAFCSQQLALRKAQSDLDKMSRELCSFSLSLPSPEFELEKGDRIRVSYSPLGLTDIVVLIKEINYGNGIDNKIRLKVIQDVFDLPLATDFGAVAENNTNEVVALDVNRYFVAEAPYLELVQRTTEATVNNELADAPDRGYLIVAASRPQQESIGAEFYADSGAGLERLVSVDYCPSAILVSAIGKTEQTLTISDGIDLDLTLANQMCAIDDEILLCTQVAADGSVTFKRGVLDTVPMPHAADAPIVWFDIYGEVPQSAFADSTSIDTAIVNLTNNSQKTTLTNAVTIASRAIRPYPPANVKINGEYFPTDLNQNTIDLTWADRNRLFQTSGVPIGWYDSDIMPESGVTYYLVIKDALGAFVHNASVGSANSHSVNVTSSPSEYFDIELWSVRDGYDSYQKFTHRINYIDQLLTEDGQDLIGEDGSLLISEV